MAPYRILDLTVGAREQIALTDSVAAVIAWAPWCVGPFRLKYVERAVADAVKMVKREMGESTGPQVEDPPPPQSFACELATMFGGTPDEWRRVRWRDAVYMVEFKGYIETPPGKSRAPVWGQRRGAIDIPGLDTNTGFRQVA